MAEYPDELRLPFSITVRMPPQPDGGIVGERLRAPPPGALPDISPGSRRPNQGGPVAREPRSTARATVRSVVLGVAPPAAVPKLVPGAVVTLIAKGIAFLVSILSLPEMLLGFAAAGLIIVIVNGVRYAFTDPAAALAWARQVVDALAAADGVPMPDPLPPLPPMVAGPELPAHTGHDQPTVRLLPQPPPSRPLTLPTGLPGPEITQLGPFILETGEGTSSRGARRTARHADPKVIQHLADAEWRAHHLINLAAVRGGDEVIRAATRAGWLPNEVANVAALPHTREAQKRLRRKDEPRPVHDSGHPEWIRDVSFKLKNIQKDLHDRFDDIESPERDQAALDALRKLQEELRDFMLKQNRLTMLQGQGPQEDA